jgi:hypothetical protein
MRKRTTKNKTKAWLSSTSASLSKLERADCGKHKGQVTRGYVHTWEKPKHAKAEHGIEQG